MHQANTKVKGPVDEIVVGNVIAQLWIEKTWFGKQRRVMSIARWNVRAQVMCVPRFHDATDFADLQQVCSIAKSRWKL